MQVIPINKTTNSTEFMVSIGQKGQITLPKPFRDKLKIRAKDKLVVRLKDKSMSVDPAESSLDAIYQIGKPLKKQLTDQEQVAIAMEEHAKVVAAND